MKRILFIITCMCLFLCACGRDEEHYYYMEEEITAFVQEHEQELRQQMEDAGEASGVLFFVSDMPSSHGGASWAGGYGWSEIPTQKENLWRYEEDAGNK